LFLTITAYLIQDKGKVYPGLQKATSAPNRVKSYLGVWGGFLGWAE